MQLTVLEVRSPRSGGSIGLTFDEGSGKQNLCGGKILW